MNQTISVFLWWYTWNIRLQPGEYKVIDFSYQYENSADENGTKMIYMPLEFIKAWVDMPRNVELTVLKTDSLITDNPSVCPMNMTVSTGFPEV